MLPIVLQIMLFLALPPVALGLAKRYRLFEWLNPVVFCYVAGMIMANSPLIEVHGPTAKMVTEASIPLAIPLVLFSSDFKAWLSQSRPTVISFVCAVVAVCISSFAAAQFLGHFSAESWKISGMLVGVYTGGTPNLLGIGMALEASEETFVLLNAADVVIGGAYLLVLLTVAKPLLKHVYPAYDGPIVEETATDDDDDRPTYRTQVFHGLGLLGLSVAIVAASVGLTFAIFGELAVAGVFLGITTGGIAASLSTRIRNLEGSYELGNYFILVFCVAMGARTDLGELWSAGSSMLIYTLVVITGALVIHFILARLFRIDVDTLIITSTAAVYGPAFVAPIAEAIDNRNVILSGLTAGLVGYAVGNYMGLALAYLLQP